MTILAIQYLESNPGSSPEIQRTVRGKLRAALDILPISLVLIGWEASESLIHICREEAGKSSAKLFRWHPLLTGDGDFFPRPEWQTVGLQGERVPGFRRMPEFTFVCPNRPAVQEATSAHLAKILHTGLYDGLFLDRIRFPSPTASPSAWLACFCPHCHAAAGEAGLDLAQVRFNLNIVCSSVSRIGSLASLLFRQNGASELDVNLDAVDRFLDFRTSSITNFVSKAAGQIRAHGLEIGLDTFSPSLANLVGQDLQSLNAYADWMKPMIYGHTLGPSGLPFELGELAYWLVDEMGMREGEAMRLLADSLQQPLPETIGLLRERGVLPDVLQEEVARGRSAGVGCLLAGIELVELAGVTNLFAQRIKDDLQAYFRGGADGLVLSWDLQLMPLEWLELVAAQLESKE